MLSLHADWWVGDDDRFRETARTALAVAAEHDVLVTVGIAPTRAEVGYGYIEPGEPLDARAQKAARFVEKPAPAEAEALIARGALWNSGLFAWTARRFAAEARTAAPELAPHLELLEQGRVADFYRAVTPIAVDHSHFERSARVAVVTGGFPWDDVGTWAALARVRAADAEGNVAVGEVELHEAIGSIAWTDDGPLVLDGVAGLVVVRANGMTLVTTVERATRLKALVETLPAHLRGEPA